MEAYLATHNAWADGLQFAEGDEGHYTIITMGSAGDSFGSSLLQLVNKDEGEMLDTLTNDDVFVTSQHDKDNS